MAARAPSVATSVAALLARPGIDPVERRILLSHVLGVSHVALASRPEHPVLPDQLARYDALEARRRAGEPVAYLVGRREFYGRDFRCGPAALIPRPETELLVDLALARIPSGSNRRVLDLGTGTGVLAITLALERPEACVTGVDIAADALELARANGAALGARVTWVESDWYQALPPEPFDLIVSNPPYVALSDSHLGQGDLRFEPMRALTDGGDGLAALRQVICASWDWLNPGAWLLLEHGHDQAAPVRDALAAARYDEVTSWRDLSGIERASGGRRRLPTGTGRLD